MIIAVEENDEGESFITLPDEIIEKFDLKPGDDVHFRDFEDGSIEMTFFKHITVKELEDGDRFDKVIDEIEKGRRYTIYEADKPVAMMIPYEF